MLENTRAILDITVIFGQNTADFFLEAMLIASEASVSVEFSAFRILDARNFRAIKQRKPHKRKNDCCAGYDAYCLFISVFILFGQSSKSALKS